MPTERLLGTDTTSGEAPPAAASRVRAPRHAVPDGLVDLPTIPTVDPRERVIADPRTSDGPPPTLRPGELIAGQYEVIGPIARGGIGWIHLARDRAVADRWVVLKGLRDPGDPHAAAAAITERRFLAEVEHPNIVRIFNFVEHRGDGYIVMELAPGISLRRMLDARRDANGGRADPLPVTHAIVYVLDAMLALAHLHRIGLVFCDFKPDNVVVTSDAVKLVDLGGAWRVGEPVEAFYGTVGYQAPEVARRGPSIASDVFTVGRTLAVLCLDIPEFAQDHRYELPDHADTPVLDRFRSLDLVLRRATALDPDQRFASVDELAGQFLGVLHEIVAAERGDPAPRVSTLFTGELHSAESGAPAWRSLPSVIVDTHDPAAGLLATMGSARPGELIDLLADAPVRTPEVELRMARALLEQGNVAQADSLLDARVAADPDDWRAAWYRGIGALAADDTRTASRRFASVYHDLPGELAPKLALGHVDFAAGRWRDAARWYDTVSRTDDAFTTASFGLARCCLEDGDLDGAVAAYDRVPETSTAWVAAQVGKVRTLAASSERTEDFARLAAAGAILDGLTLEAIRHHRLAVEVLTVGLHLTSSASAAARTGATLLGRPLTEAGMRSGLETSYRALARQASTRAERIALVDRANQVRPRTLL